MLTISISWFNGPNVQVDDGYLDGIVGLREYFFAGKGTEDSPYEIVTPLHLYNLERLQNLGIFSGKTYFQVGHLFDIEGVPTLKCIDHYDSDGNPIYCDYINMEGTKLLPIGGEGVPFVGTINGNGIPIKNLTVRGNPEDIGVFGYVASEGKVEGMVFEDLEVVSLGYSNDSTSSDNLLFSENIDDIFDTSGTASYLTTGMNLDFYEFNATTNEYDVTNLKRHNPVGGTYVNNANDANHIVADTDLFNGYFKATFPSVEGDRFTYTLSSSSPVIRRAGDTIIGSCSEDDLIIDMSALKESSLYNSTSNTQVNARLYLKASCVVDGYTFSRVIQTYKVEFHNGGHLYADGQTKISIYCDYLDTASTGDMQTGYHHGINVGLIAGHVDGTVQNCYVYNGKIKFNDSTYHPVAAESDTALIGEIGENVSSNINPELGLVVHGDIGVMNFSKIYSMIRSDMSYPKTIKAGSDTTQGVTTHYVSYKEFLNQESIANFKDYLRYYDGKKEEQEFIIPTSSDMSKISPKQWHNYDLTSSIPLDFNTVEFLWNRVVQDDDNTDRGLGVFKVVSSYNQYANEESYGTYMLSNIGDCIIKNDTPKTKVYFSTAEYDHNQSGPTWGTGDGKIEPLRATTLPSYSDVSSFKWPFSRDYNYVFELDLSQMNQAGGRDYMYNTTSQFLTNYLSSKLIDKYGAPVTPGTDRFGFMFRSSENELLSQLSSYMPVKVPGDKKPFTDPDTGETFYYPTNSIVFRIENPNGANVSVVGNGENITVYSYDPKKSTGSKTALYTMYSKNIANDVYNEHRYFTYDVSTDVDNTGTETVCPIANGDGGALYGHIFNLPQGDYVLGSQSGTAKVYFLAVQGQTEGSIGHDEVVSVDGTVADVDFLLDEPSLSTYPSGLNKALFSFKAVFNTELGEVFVDTITVGEKKYMRVTFDNSTVFLTYLLAYSRHTEHTYYINGVAHDTTNWTYP